METSLVVLLFVPILLANTLTASILRNGANPGEVACDPAANPSDCPSNRRCEDMDGDGQSTCVCDSRFYKTNAAGNCVLGLKELIYEMEKEIETLKANVSDNANDIASNEAQISMNAANITAADDQVNMEAMDEMKDKLDALNQSLSGDLDQAMMDLEELELKQQEDINWLNDTMNELLLIPTTTATTTTTTVDAMMACQDANDGFHPAFTISESCYRISKTYKNFDDASETCSTLGGKLYEPKTEAINYEIATEANKVIFNGESHWIGINDKETEGTWVYNSDGQTIEWSNWRSGEPDDGSNSNCVTTWGSSSDTKGFWSSDPCYGIRFFICEF